MKWTMSILTAAIMATLTGVAAQSGTMSQDRKMDGMATMNGKDATYTGCIEAAGVGSFKLAHAVAATAGMAAGSMKESSMKTNDRAMTTMTAQTMTSSTLTLSSPTIALSKHVGHKVSVTGSLVPKMATAGHGGTANEPATFTVKSLKTVSGSCS